MTSKAKFKQIQFTVPWLGAWLLRCVVRVRFPSGTNIYIAFRFSDFYVTLIVCKCVKKFLAWGMFLRKIVFVEDSLFGRELSASVSSISSKVKKHSNIVMQNFHFSSSIAPQMSLLSFLSTKAHVHGHLNTRLLI